MPALAVTDWANLYGTLAFNKALKKSPGLKGIYGVEMGILIPQSDPILRHCVLLAKNNKGFAQLRDFVSRAHKDYGYSEEKQFSPHLPFEVLKEAGEDLICLTGGMKGILNSFLVQGQDKFALKILEELKTVFGDRLYLELQASQFSVHEEACELLKDWGRAHSVPLVATSDVHYMDAEDAFAHEVWMMVSHKLNLETNPRSSLLSGEFSFKSPDEMKMAFSSCPEAIENTLKIAQECSVDFNFTDQDGKRIYFLPSFHHEGKDQDTFFKDEAHEGLENKFKKDAIEEDLKETYRKRLEYEVDVIGSMGFAGYYLIVSDFIRWAKRNKIPVGPGRGSGAGSLVAYVLDIIDLDPIENNLVFERFLNPERVSLPDFDIDFCQARRHEVIEYVAQKYGNDHVCQIVTFAKEQSKNALKDVGRVLGFSFAETNRMTKFIPTEQAKPLTITESLEAVQEFSDLYHSDLRTKELVDLAKKIEGGLRQPGVHAAGVIIASEAIDLLAPVSRDVNGNLITQWDMKMSEEAGLVKFDFLGLVTLDLLDLACRFVREKDGVAEEHKDIQYDTIPVHDPKIYELISAGDTLGVFQLESSGMQNLCQRIKPDCFDDISAINALFRPGPLESGMVDDFIDRKHGRAEIEVIFPELEKILDETYGVILYQEQVMNIARAVSGYTLGGADLLRRAMGKKIQAEMEAQREIFVTGAEKNKKNPEKASELFDLIAKFAGYGFNKSHAAAYAKLAVQTAYLKAVYPTEFFAALLTIDKEKTDKLSKYIKDARNHGIEILAPDINESGLNFTIVKEGVIRFGLSAIKNVGEAAVESIVSARDSEGTFEDLFHFASKIDARKINKRVLESLIQCGAFDSLKLRSEDLEKHRASYLATVESVLEWASKETAVKATGQFSLFDESSESQVLKPKLKKGTALSEKEMLSWEKELLGVYISSSPLDRFADKIEQLGCLPLETLVNYPPKKIVSVAGIVTDFREAKIKRGRRMGELMAIFTIEDLSGSVEFVSFPDHYSKYAELIKSGDPLCFKAELDIEEERAKLMGFVAKNNSEIELQKLEDIQDKFPKQLSLTLSLKGIEAANTPHIIDNLKRILKAYPGAVPVQLRLLAENQYETKLDLPEELYIHPQESLMKDLDAMFLRKKSLVFEYRY